MTLVGKRALIFSGREHHTQRLDGIYQALEAAGANVSWIVAENSINLDVPAIHLIKTGRKFIHMMDYFPPGHSGNVVKSASEVLNSISGEWSSDVRSFVGPFWLAHSVHEACEYLLCFDAMLVKEKPDLVMALHGANFWSAGLYYLCSKRGIPTMGFQEGNLRHRDQETQNKQTLAAECISHLCVWSEASKQAYIQAGVPESKLYVTGIPHLDPWLKERPAKQGKVVAFCPPLTSRYEGDLGKAVGQLAEWAQKSRVNLVLRFHPFDNVAENVRQQLVSNPFVQVFTGETLELLSVADVVISQHSTVAVEALALGVPLVELDIDGVGVLESLVQQGVAIPVGDGELDKLNKILDGTLRLDSANLQKWRSHNLGELDSKSVERVVNVIEGILA